MRVLQVFVVALLFLGLQFLPLNQAGAQTVSGVRGINGGVGALFNLVGQGNLYIDTQGTHGYMYNYGSNFESYSFRVPGGQAWTGAVMTLGPQLTVGLIAGANQGAGPVVFPPAPRQVTLPPAVESSLLEDIP
jgi:hypothetical protein